MRRRIDIRVLLSCLVAVTLVAPVGVPAAGQPRSIDDIERRLNELEDLRRELDEREGDVRSGIDEAAARREKLTDEIAELQAIVDEVQGRVDAEAADLASVQGRLDTKLAEIDEQERRLEARLDALGDRAAYMYKRGPASFFDMLFGIDGVGDLVRRVGYLTNIAGVDNRRVAHIEEAKAELQAQREEIEELRDREAEQLAAVAAERNRAAAVRNQADARRAAVVGELESGYAELGSIEEQRAQYERETADLQAESAAIAAFLRGRGDTPAEVSPKGMTWPASGPLTSGFGWRTHPIFGTRRFHAGIDIGASSGSAIVAAGTGTVASVGPRSGYGNATIIDHGGGVATLYAHQSSIGVSTGTRVAIGQRIGAVGCTGYCTGPHLHFEVRVNGDPVDPMGWLP